jgi:hypothetical protein
MEFKASNVHQQPERLIPPAAAEQSATNFSSQGNFRVDIKRHDIPSSLFLSGTGE